MSDCFAPITVLQPLSLAPRKQTYSTGPFDAADERFSVCHLQIHTISRKFHFSKWDYSTFNDDERTPRAVVLCKHRLFECVKQRLCSSQIGRLKAFREAIINWLKQRLGVGRAALIP